MFCPKCGMKAADGGVFCQKCGARLVADEAGQSDSVTALSGQEYTKAPDHTVNVPEKMKKGKTLILLGMLVLAVLAIAAASGISEEEIDYVATVKGHKPLEEAQGLDITYGAVFDQYMNKPDWKVRESGDIHYVDINGADRGTGNEFAVTFKVSPDPDDDSMSLIEPESVVYNGEKFSTKDDATDFLVSLFCAYNGDKGKSDMKSEETAPSETSATEKTEQDAGDTADQLLYNGIPVDTIMEMKAEDVIAAFGEPDDETVSEDFIQILSKNGKRLVIVANFDSAGYVSYFAGDPEKYEVNGQKLNHDYDKLVEIFGRAPDCQEMYDLYEIKWFYDSYSILFGLDEDGLPGKTEVRKKNTKDEAEQLVYDWIENAQQMEDACYLGYVDEGILQESGQEVYNFSLMADENTQFFISVEKDTGTMWAILGDGTTMPLYEYGNKYLPNGFMWIEEPAGKYDYFATYITGIVQNTSDQTYSHVSVTFDLYDSSGNRIGSAVAAINNLKAGGTWKFEAIGESNASKFEFSSIDCY